MRDAAFIIDGDGLPTITELAVRESTTAPGRLKVAFVCDVPSDATVCVPTKADSLPLPKGIEGKIMMGDEFRLELN